MDKRVPLSTRERRFTAKEKRLAKAVSQALIDLRKRRRLSVEELAKKAGLSVTRIENFECGKRFPYLTELESLAGALRMRTWHLAKYISDAMDKVLPPLNSKHKEVRT